MNNKERKMFPKNLPEKNKKKTGFLRNRISNLQMRKSFSRSWPRSPPGVIGAVARFAHA